jgi:hypothetical protein
LSPANRIETRFGSSVDVHNRWAAIGAYADDTIGADAGAAYLYDIANTT